MNKCREAFEQHIDETKALTVFYKNRDPKERRGEGYGYNDIQPLWVIWKTVWNASHDRCMEFCDKVECRPVSVEFENSVCYQIKEYIQNDKVKV